MSVWRHSGTGNRYPLADGGYAALNHFANPWLHSMSKLPDCLNRSLKTSASARIEFLSASAQWR